MYSERRVASAVARRCDACGEVVRPHDYHVRVTVHFDGRWERPLRRCLRCQAIHEHLRGLTRGWGEWPDELLACGCSYEDLHGPCPPEVAALAFALPGDAIVSRL